MTSCAHPTRLRSCAQYSCRHDRRVLAIPHNSAHVHRNPTAASNSTDPICEAHCTALHSAALLSCASLCVVSALRLECIGRRDRRLQHARSRAKHQRTHRRRKQGRELTIPHTRELISVAHWWHYQHTSNVQQCMKQMHATHTKPTQNKLSTCMQSLQIFATHHAA